MRELLGSRVKEQILLYLGLRGGASGRRLARNLKTSPTQVFKALLQLKKSGIILKFGPPFFYVLNSDYIYHDELIRIIQKKYDALRKKPAYLPLLADDRKVDPFAVYELSSVIGPGPKIMKLSEALRRRYA